jgi:hypothetical protein
MPIIWLLNKEKTWDQLTKEQQNNLHSWLIQANENIIPPNNWHFFRDCFAVLLLIGPTFFLCLTKEMYLMLPSQQSIDHNLLFFPNKNSKTIYTVG